MTATRPPLLAADMIREMTRTHTTTSIVHRDNGEKELHHITEVPLLDQLAGITGSSSLSDTDATKGAFMSKPAAHLGAADALARINHQARAMARSLDVPDHGTLDVVLGRLSGALGHDTHPRVRSWWAMARLLTQHDSPAHRPHGVPCPTCWDINSLRIRIDDELATCTSCGDVWDRTGEPDHGSLDVLGQHVAWCAEHEVTKARHWDITADGYPTECIDCLAFRQAWAEWRLAHQPGVDGAGRMTA